MLILSRRIDFREFVRDLFGLYKTRIWMQQVDPAELLQLQSNPNFQGQVQAQNQIQSQIQSQNQNQGSQFSGGQGLPPFSNKGNNLMNGNMNANNGRYPGIAAAGITNGNQASNAMYGNGNGNVGNGRNNLQQMGNPQVQNQNRGSYENFGELPSYQDDFYDPNMIGSGNNIGFGNNSGNVVNNNNVTSINSSVNGNNNNIDIYQLGASKGFSPPKPSFSIADNVYPLGGGNNNNIAANGNQFNHSEYLATGMNNVFNE